jgi:hypothetical protein
VPLIAKPAEYPNALWSSCYNGIGAAEKWLQGYEAMHYHILNVTDHLLYIKWYQSPSAATKPQGVFVDDLRARLDASAHPLYFLSDLREGRIADVGILQRLGRLTDHPNYGAGAAFSKDVVSNIFVEVFSKFARQEKGHSVFYDKMEDALAFLESFQPGLAHDIDWGAVLARLP